MVRGNVDAVADSSYMLTDWLLAIRLTAFAAGPSAKETWQWLADALVVAGDAALAPYSD